MSKSNGSKWLQIKIFYICKDSCFICEYSFFICADIFFYLREQFFNLRRQFLFYSYEEYFYKYVLGCPSNLYFFYSCEEIYFIEVSQTNRCISKNLFFVSAKNFFIKVSQVDPGNLKFFL